MTIALPDRLTDQGAEARVLIAECATPAIPGYTLGEARKAMQYMDAVLWNRVDDPLRYGAKKGATLVDIIRAKGQFKGFESYPGYSSAIVYRIQQCLDIANNPKDSRSGAYSDFVSAALSRAAAPFVEDPSPGRLTGWRKAGHGSPGAGFTAFVTVLGNTFYWVPKQSR